MRVWKDPLSNQTELYLNDEETEQLRQMIAGASLPLRRTFNELLYKL